MCDVITTIETDCVRYTFYRALTDSYKSTPYLLTVVLMKMPVNEEHSLVFHHECIL
jgi:hypothetical protein